MHEDYAAGWSFQRHGETLIQRFCNTPLEETRSGVIQGRRKVVAWHYLQAAVTSISIVQVDENRN